MAAPRAGDLPIHGSSHPVAVAPHRPKGSFMLTVDIALPDVDELQRLAQEAREKGFLTYDEIARALEEVDLTKDQFDEFLRLSR